MSELQNVISSSMQSEGSEEKPKGKLIVEIE